MPEIWEDGGGVMEEVVRGAGEVNFTRSGDASFDMLRAAVDSEGDAERSLGVSGRVDSVVGINESCDAGYSGAWESMLAKAQLAWAMQDTSGVQGTILVW
jgi:hypothetical protein